MVLEACSWSILQAVSRLVNIWRFAVMYNIHSCGWTLSQFYPLWQRSGRNLFIYALKHLHMRRNELLMFVCVHKYLRYVYDILYMARDKWRCLERSVYKRFWCVYIMITIMVIVMCVFYSCLHIGFLTSLYLIGRARRFNWCNVFTGYNFLSILSDHARSFHCCEIVQWLNINSNGWM